MNVTKMEFANWTEYDDWLIQNYGDKAIFEVNEVDGKICIQYASKEEFNEDKKQREAEEKAKSKAQAKEQAQ